MREQSEIENRLLLRSTSSRLLPVGRKKGLKNKKAIIIMALAFILMATHAEGQVKWKPLLKAVEFSEHDFVDTIRVRIESGAVIVPVEIAGQERHLLFDTGAEHGFWFGSQEEWMKPTDVDSAKWRDINDKTGAASVFKIPEMRMGNLGLSNYPVSVGGHLGDYICGRFDGLIGFDLVTKGLSVKLDTKDSLMIVTDRKGFFDEEAKGQPTVKYWLAKPTYPLVYVELPFGSTYMLFDTGAVGHGVDLSNQALAHWLKKEKKRATIDSATQLSDTTLNANIGLYGVHADTLLERVVHLPTVQMGSLTVKDAYASSANMSMLIGSALLKHASLIIDSAKKRYVFLPHDGSGDITLNDKTSHSMRLVPTDSTGTLQAVVRKDSEAYRKGVRTGDLLIEADGIPVVDVCTYTAIRLGKKPGEEIHFLFRSPDGTEKRVAIARTE